MKRKAQYLKKCDLTYQAQSLELSEQLCFAHWFNIAEAESLLQVGTPFVDAKTLNVPINLRVSSDSSIQTCDAVSQLSSLSFSESSFQTLRLSHVLETEPQLMHSLKECWRVLKPNGLCFIVLYNTSKLVRYTQGHFQSPVKNAVKPFSLRAFKQVAREVGFKYIHSQGISTQPKMNHFLTQHNLHVCYPTRLGVSQLHIFKKELVCVRLKPFKGKAHLSNIPSIKFCYKKKH